MSSDVFMVTEALAKEMNFLYIKEVAGRAAMTDKEVAMEFARRGWYLSGDDEEDSKQMLAIILDSYNQELKVHAAVQYGVSILDVSYQNEVCEVKKQLSWRDVFDTDKGRYDISMANAAAKQAGYDKFYWGGRVLTVDENVDLGTLEELGLK